MTRVRVVVVVKARLRARPLEPRGRNVHRSGNNPHGPLPRCAQLLCTNPPAQGFVHVSCWGRGYRAGARGGAGAWLGLGALVGWVGLWVGVRVTR